MKSLYIGFDFSMNKPAATLLWEKQFYFMVWPSDLDQKKTALLEQADVFVRPRNLKPVSTKDKNSQIVLEHTVRSTELANMIIADIDAFMTAKGITDQNNIYISSEGLSYGSKGDATLNLATYKGVLLSKLYEHYSNRLKGLYTYSPITLKATAGCVKKDISNTNTKERMINAFIKENINHPFTRCLQDSTLKSKTNYILCVDDIVDSYWALKAMLKKES